MLQAADIVFGYRGGATVLRGVSMEVPAGGFVGILGPNGSGKTTMLKVLAGTVQPSRGRVTLDGVELSRTARAALARRMAVVPQETHIAFDYSVLEVVLMGRYPHLGAFQVEGPSDVAIAREALAATGTLAFQDRPFGTLSGGEKQRVIIAAALAQVVIVSPGRADPLRPSLMGGADPLRPSLTGRADPLRPSLTGGADPLRPSLAGGADPLRPSLTCGSALPGLTRPSFLLLDEPTAALDLAYQLELAQLLTELQARTQIAVVVSTHDLNFAASLCRTLVLLRNGEVLAAGPVNEVLTPERIRALYGVEADVQRHAGTGRLIVVPMARTPGPPS